MFIGHQAAGFALKRFAPGVSLGWLFLATSVPDLLWPPLILAGVEHVRIQKGFTAVNFLDMWDYPWSHSLATNLLWGVLLGLGYWAMKRDHRGAIVLGFGVLSHWLLDYISHVPDLPLYPNGPKVGLGLWNSIPATIAVESSLFMLGVLLYLRTTVPTGKVGRIGLAGLVALLALLYAGSVNGTAPPNTTVLAYTGFANWLWVFWAAWVDRNRAIFVKRAGSASISKLQLEGRHIGA